MEKITAQELIDISTELSLMLEAKVIYIPIEKDRYAYYNGESYVAYNKKQRHEAILTVRQALTRHINLVETGNAIHGYIGTKECLANLNKLIMYHHIIKELLEFVDQKIFAGQSYTDADFELFWKQAMNIINKTEDNGIQQFKNKISSLRNL